MQTEQEENELRQSEIRELIEANRARALWHLPHDYFPPDDAAARHVLQHIAARGNRATWIRARLLLSHWKS